MLSSAGSSASSVANFSPPNHRHVWNLFLSLPVLVLLRIVAKSTPYAKQGFFCNDLEIRFPYVHDTVPPNILDWVFGVSIILAVIASECSLVRHLTQRNFGKRMHRGDGLFHPLAINCLYFIAAFYCSDFSASTICNLGKRTASRLKPNFLAVCQPKNLSALCPPDNFEYVTDYVCTNVLFDQNEYFSFPSGHAAHVCNFAVFIILYLQKRCKLPPMFRSFAQFFCALFAYYVCLSRVRDHKHRLADVMGGALTGMALGAFFIRFILANFRPNRYSLVDRGDCWPDDDQQPPQFPIIGRKFSVPSVIVQQQQNGKNSVTKGVGEASTMLGKGSASDYGSLVASSMENVFMAQGNATGTVNNDLEAGMKEAEVNERR